MKLLLNIKFVKNVINYYYFIIKSFHDLYNTFEETTLQEASKNVCTQFRTISITPNKERQILSYNTANNIWTTDLFLTLEVTTVLRLYDAFSASFAVRKFLVIKARLSFKAGVENEIFQEQVCKLRDALIQVISKLAHWTKKQRQPVEIPCKQTHKYVQDRVADILQKTEILLALVPVSTRRGTYTVEEIIHTVQHFWLILLDRVTMANYSLDYNITHVFQLICSINNQIHRIYRITITVEEIKSCEWLFLYLLYILFLLSIFLSFKKTKPGYVNFVPFQ